MTHTKIHLWQVSFDNDTCWPRPDALANTYDQPQHLVAGSYMAAFAALVWLPEKRRNEVIRALRRAAQAAKKTEDTR